MKTPNFKKKCGQVIDALLESLENYETAFLGAPTSGNGYKIDDCIRKFLPELLNSHVTPFAQGNEGCPLDINLMEQWGKECIDITREKLVVHVGKVSVVRWERYAFIKGGGALGEDVGKLTRFTYDQMKKADEIASSVLGKDAGVLSPHTYSKLFLTELQSSFNWSKEKRMWSTCEFPINTKIKINPALKKYEITKYIKMMPRMFRKLTVGSDDDLKFMSDTTNDVARVIAMHTRLSAWKEDGHKKNANDRLSAGFQLMENVNCRKIMLNFVDNDNDSTKNDQLRLQRDEHMKNCKECFVTFSHIAFGGGQDYTFVVVVCQTLEDVGMNAKWDLADGQGFRALDFFGVKGSSPEDRFKWGPCVFIRTGHAKLQGRVAAKIYSLLHAVMKAGTYKDTVDRIAVNVREVDTEKFKFFNSALKTYFCKVIFNLRAFKNDWLMYHLNSDGMVK